MTSTPRTTGPLTAAVPLLTRIATAIPTDQPARMEVGNYSHELAIRVQLVTLDDPQLGADIATELGIPAVPDRRETSDKSTELTWTGVIDGWTVIMHALQYSYAIN